MFQGVIQLQPKRAQQIVIAACVLHNLISENNPRMFASHCDKYNPVTDEMQPGSWRNNRDIIDAFRDIQRSNAHQSLKDSRKQREYLKHYYSSEQMKLPWQDARL